MFNITPEIYETAKVFLFQGIKFVLILVVGIQLIKFVVNKVRKSKIIDKFNKSLKSLIISAIKFGLYSVLVVILCSIFGIDTTSFIAVIASCGIAVGLALQGILTNIASALTILIFRPFEVGDYVECASAAGTVKEIGILYTRFQTVDNKTITVPNSSITSSMVVNYSKTNTRRLDLNFDVSYKSDIEKVKSIIKESALKHELVLKDEEIFVRLIEMKDSSLQFQLRVWTLASDLFTVKIDLLEEIKIKFDQNNIEIPYPQLDVHLDK